MCRAMLGKHAGSACATSTAGWLLGDLHLCQTVDCPGSWGDRECPGKPMMYLAQGGTICQEDPLQEDPLYKQIDTQVCPCITLQPGLF